MKTACFPMFSFAGVAASTTTRNRKRDVHRPSRGGRRPAPVGCRRKKIVQVVDTQKNAD